MGDVDAKIHTLELWPSVIERVIEKTEKVIVEKQV